MEPVYLKQTISSDPTETANAEDVNSPFSYLEWKQRRPNLVETHAKYHYGQYILKWFQENKSKDTSKVFVLKQKYFYLLDQLQLFFTTEEKTEWYNKINLMDEKELLLAIPYFAKKLKTIALYYLNLRKRLKNTKLQYNMTGTAFGLEQQISNLLLQNFTNDNKELDPSLYSHVSTLSSLGQTLVVQVEELYDDTDYMDKSPAISPSNYYNIFHVATEKYFNTKGISLSSGDWIFNSLTLDPNTNAETFVAQLTGNLLEATDGDLFTSCIEKYLAENKKLLSYVPESETLEEKEISIQSGSNQFYYPGTNIDPSISFENIIDPVEMSSLTLKGATGGTSLETADTIFVKNGQDIKAAWLRYEQHKKEDKILLANLKQNDVTSFIFPYPGYGLSGEDFSWSGSEFQSTIGYNFLSNTFKQAVNEAYWNQALDIDSCEPIYINNSSLVESGATSNKNPKFADELTLKSFREGNPSLPLVDGESAWLYKFDQAVYPISINSSSKFLWPYQLISSEKDSYGSHLESFNFENVCTPIHIKDLVTPYSIGSDNISTADVIYKFSNYSNEVATECCWLSSTNTKTSKYKTFNQRGFSATFANDAIRFVWTGPTQTLDNVFSSIDHSADCPFVTNVPPLSSFEPDKCTCKQVYYSPFGHPGTTFQANNQLADFIAVDTGTVEAFDIGSWRDTAGKPFAESQYVAWYKTNSKIGWGDGSWVNNSNSSQSPFQLETGKSYFYKRANFRTGNSSMPSYIVNYNFNLPPSFSSKWIGAKLQEDEWVSTGLDSNMVLYPGDFIQYKRAGQTTSYYVSSEQVEDQSKNVNSIWSTFDYVVSGTAQDTTYILWPTDEKPMGGGTLSQYPSTSFFDLSAIYWWKIVHTQYPSLSTIIYSPKNEQNTYNNKTIFSFTPPATGTYSITVSAAGKTGNGFLFTQIPQLTVVPQYYEQELLVPIQHSSAGFLLEQPLYGWNYNINKADSSASGAKPYWAQKYSDKSNATKFKGIQSWGYPNEYIDGYLPDHAPKISPVNISYGSIVHYNRVGYTFNWQQPIEFKTFTATSTWCKLNHSIDSFSNLGALYNSKNSINLTVYPTTEPSDIILTNILNGFPVEVFYNALNSFTWMLSVKKNDAAISENIPQMLFESPKPWTTISNRFYPTVATVPTLEKVYSEKDKGGYFLPQHMGASLFINKDFNTFLKNQTTKDELVEDLNIHIGGGGRTKFAQSTVYDWTENNQWMKEPSTAGFLAGGVKTELTKTLQTFVPYEESSEEVTLGLVTPRSRMSPWGGTTGEQWTDIANEPKGFTGVRNISAWVEDQVLKTNEKSVERWFSDIYGNQYGLVKNLNGIAVSDQKNVLGELWVRTNDQKVIPGSKFLINVYDKFKHKPFYSNLFGENIKTIECFLDTLIIETVSALILLPLEYDYETSVVTTSYDNAILVENLSAFKKYEGSWVFPKTKSITLLFTERDIFSNNFVPVLYSLSLDTRKFSKIFPNKPDDLNDVANGIANINFGQIEQAVFSYNSIRQTYLITYLGKQTNNAPLVIDFKIEQQENLKITSIDRYIPNIITTGPTPTLPSVNLSQYGNITQLASTSFSVQIIATGNPTSWNLLGGAPSGISLSNSGLLHGSIPTSGTYFINYQITNSVGTVTYPLTLTIL